MRMFQEWTPLMVNAFIAGVGRALDLLSTWYVTPKLRLETSRVIGRLGWKGAVVLQLPVVALASFHVFVALFVLFFSLFLAAGNVQGAWFVRGIGEENYFRLMVEAVRKAKWREIVASEAAHLVLHVAPAAALTWITLSASSFQFSSWDTYTLALPILLALAFYGFLGTFRMLTYLHRLKKAAIVMKKGGGNFKQTPSSFD
ncbi:MAG: hypothetical protein QXY80_06600 [Candidatus Jordarchaeales archaeon]